MQKYVIEREISGAGKLTEDELRAISQKSCSALEKLGQGIQWVESFVTENKIYCVYYAKDKQIIKDHAMCGGFPINRIERVITMINPVTANQPEEASTKTNPVTAN
ncbi:MAG: DUF4242 domain-containing protein [Bacteroidetes bacterium]|nr:MAG: DUF4242 domain-containing protein [Bacteroidota bacterium]